MNPVKAEIMSRLFPFYFRDYWIFMPVFFLPKNRQLLPEYNGAKLNLKPQQHQAARSIAKNMLYRVLFYCLSSVKKQHQVHIVLPLKKYQRLLFKTCH